MSDNRYYHLGINNNFMYVRIKSLDIRWYYLKEFDEQTTAKSVMGRLNENKVRIIVFKNVHVDFVTKEFVFLNTSYIVFRYSLDRLPQNSAWTENKYEMVLELNKSLCLSKF